MDETNFLRALQRSAADPRWDTAGYLDPTDPDGNTLIESMRKAKLPVPAVPRPDDTKFPSLDGTPDTWAWTTDRSWSPDLELESIAATWDCFNKLIHPDIAQRNLFFLSVPKFLWGWDLRLAAKVGPMIVIQQHAGRFDEPAWKKRFKAHIQAWNSLAAKCRRMPRTAPTHAVIYTQTVKATLDSSANRTEGGDANGLLFGLPEGWQITGDADTDPAALRELADRPRGGLAGIAARHLATLLELAGPDSARRS